jgi:hypothetical protein
LAITLNVRPFEEFERELKGKIQSPKTLLPKKKSGTHPPKPINRQGNPPLHAHIFTF